LTLLKSNHNDNVGARYSIVAILMGLVLKELDFKEVEIIKTAHI